MYVSQANALMHVVYVLHATFSHVHVFFACECPINDLIAYVRAAPLSLCVDDDLLAIIGCCEYDDRIMK